MCQALSRYFICVTPLNLLTPFQLYVHHTDKETPAQEGKYVSKVVKWFSLAPMSSLNLSFQYPVQYL